MASSMIHPEELATTWLRMRTFPYAGDELSQYLRNRIPQLLPSLYLLPMRRRRRSTRWWQSVCIYRLWIPTPSAPANARAQRPLIHLATCASSETSKRCLADPPCRQVLDTRHRRPTIGFFHWHFHLVIRAVSQAVSAATQSTSALPFPIL